ncbi:MAG TPA: hypothetical protein VLH38_00885 [Patescibacteria group bacterium]|nr:hypothetical protein [Patescibacteria group bacterium]
MTQLHEQHILDPEYWDGYDINDNDLFENNPYTPLHRLEQKTYARAHEYLLEGLGQVAAGNVTEVRYRAGNEFNADLEEGSLVVVESESLLDWKPHEPQEPWQSRLEHRTIPITRPYSDYWLNNQDGEDAPNLALGSETTIFPEQHAQHTRSVKWGVIVEEKDSRYIQPFDFGTTKVLPDGSVYAPYWSKSNAFLRGFAHEMPLAIGQAKVETRLHMDSGNYDALSRIKGVDVVYPAASRRQTVRRKSLGRFLLPKFAAGQA